MSALGTGTHVVVHLGYHPVVCTAVISSGVPSGSCKVLGRVHDWDSVTHRVWVSPETSPCFRLKPGWVAAEPTVRPGYGQHVAGGVDQAGNGNVSLLSLGGVIIQ